MHSRKELSDISPTNTLSIEPLYKQRRKVLIINAVPLFLNLVCYFIRNF